MNSPIIYLTSPEPDRFVINIEFETEITQLEISRDHLKNIVMDGLHHLNRGAYKLDSTNADYDQQSKCDRPSVR